ncbi:hypothetical protein PAESOLCIP111_01511 [Paenibacillus solanacearum]|uniref:DUF3973 domain-containing protein n=1 Tax=Paenibacillus solanacearum TaxID=2048548 RepID=A0A916NVY3_9BACL|nr:hypothetical protein [Paenibacillus solanacearum]CAG7612285.1 hypothetical protein PAESOLCIP111_01511 [Paenibacillus solanacearum]
MKNDLYYYCFICEKVEPIHTAKKIFKTGFSRIGSDNYHVGYCKESKDTESKWSSFNRSLFKSDP